MFYAKNRYAHGTQQKEYPFVNGDEWMIEGFLSMM